MQKIKGEKGRGKEEERKRKGRGKEMCSFFLGRYIAWGLKEHHTCHKSGCWIFRTRGREEDIGGAAGRLPKRERKCRSVRQDSLGMAVRQDLETMSRNLNCRKSTKHNVLQQVLLGTKNILLQVKSLKHFISFVYMFV